MTEQEIIEKMREMDEAVAQWKESFMMETIDHLKEMIDDVRAYDKFNRNLESDLRKIFMSK